MRLRNGRFHETATWPRWPRSHSTRTYRLTRNPPRDHGTNHDLILTRTNGLSMSPPLGHDGHKFTIAKRTVSPLKPPRNQELIGTRTDRPTMSLPPDHGGHDLIGTRMDGFSSRRPPWLRWPRFHDCEDGRTHYEAATCNSHDFKNPRRTNLRQNPSRYQDGRDSIRTNISSLTWPF